MLQSYTEYVKRYGIAELVFRGPSEGNPFAEQWVKGTMAGQAEEKHAEGFMTETAYTSFALCHPAKERMRLPQ